MCSATDPGEDTSSSSSTGPTCEPELGELYDCYGWRAGLYQRVGQPNKYAFLLGSGEKEYQCTSERVCMPAESTLQEIVAQCRSQCEPVEWPLTIGPYFSLYDQVCVFEQNGNWGYVPNTWGYGIPGPGKVPNYNQVGGCPGVGPGTGPVGGPVSGGYPLIPMTNHLGSCELPCQ